MSYCAIVAILHCHTTNKQLHLSKMTQILKRASLTKAGNDAAKNFHPKSLVEIMKKNKKLK